VIFWDNSSGVLATLAIPYGTIKRVQETLQSMNGETKKIHGLTVQASEKGFAHLKMFKLLDHQKYKLLNKQFMEIKLSHKFLRLQQGTRPTPVRIYKRVVYPKFRCPLLQTL